MPFEADQDVVHDLIAVGAGPSALCALWAAKRAELSAFAIDKGPVCGALAGHPTYMRWFSTADKLELPGLPLLTEEKNPSRREYLKYCRAYTKHHGLHVETYTTVTKVSRTDVGFVVDAADRFGRVAQWRTRNVLMATGFYDFPRAIGVPGEDLPHVSHRYLEAHYYSGHKVTVVGAGSSAAEIALELWREGAEVTVVMRSDSFHTKYWIEPDIENRIKEGSIACYRKSTVERIEADAIHVRTESGAVAEVACDFVLAMTGYEPDTTQLRGLGAEVDTASNKPVLSDAFETTVPGLYVAGTLCAGIDANVIFIENSRDHGPTIIENILARQDAPIG